MKRVVMAVLGAVAGLLVASMLPIWPLLFHDIIRTTPLWFAIQHPDSTDTWVLPLVICAVLMAAGAIALRNLTKLTLRYLSLRRSRAGLCLHCGYDLTGNASGICPECGTTTLQNTGIGGNDSGDGDVALGRGNSKHSG
ncbi:MAG TPA: hypothetical protein VIM11_17840 [Tepidisphaeraceae bacterium]|jgi:hypothetical protein